MSRAGVTVEGLSNLREVGGLPVSGGGRVRHGLLYRAAAPVGLSTTARQTLATLGLRAVVDLRDQREEAFVEAPIPAGSVRRRVAVTPPVDHLGKGLIAQIAAGDVRRYGSPDLAAQYVLFLEARPTAFGEVVRLCADARNLPCLVHCAAGKDRTGLSIALILEAIGVTRDAVLDDYERTSEALSPPHLALDAAIVASGVDPSALSAVYSAPRRALAGALEQIEVAHGSVRGYLRERGTVTDTELHALVNLFVE
jgi:protein-tyrosine phosphatase